MQVENKIHCTGCGACYNACPVGAITMEYDKYGFYKPVIDREKCTHCGLCEKTCPLDKNNSNNFDKPKVFAFQNKDKETLYKSASGGAFSAFATQIINNGGIVYGVVWNENIVAVHERAENIEQLEKMYSSKYVQANTNNSFKQAKDDLETGKTVLFSGTPCQIAGLKAFLRKGYENLYTVDLVCHGVPSPLIFEKYKQELMSEFSEDEKLININFRSKIKGWSPLLINTVITNKNIQHIPASKDSYMNAFLNNLSINFSCLNCQFNTIPRIADISLADFWGVDSYKKELNDNKGLSLILINNSKAETFVNTYIKGGLLEEIPLEYAIKCNKNICGSSIAHKNREKFLNKVCVENKTLKYCVKKYNKVPFHIAIYRLLPKFVKNFIKYKILKMEK